MEEYVPLPKMVPEIVRLSFCTVGWRLRIQYNISIVPGVPVGNPHGAHDVGDTRNGNAMKGGGGRHRAGPEGVIPPPPQVKTGRGPPYPTPRVRKPYPHPRVPRGYPLPFSGH
jgi:hypothetical protein